MTQHLASSLEAAELAAYAVTQANHSFPDPNPVTIDDLMPAIPTAMARLEHCFAQVNSGTFFDGTRAVFNHLHGDQYAMWLYILSNELYRQGADAAICSKLFLLNKALHGCDMFYEVDLPSVFLVVHPVGTVLGRGTYSDYFVAYQRCGVGSNRDVYPTFGRHVTLRPGSAVLGDSKIGDCCQIATESLVLDRSIDSNTLYIGKPKDFIERDNSNPNKIWRH